MNGRNGWMIFTKQGEQVADAQDLRKLREAAEFPKSVIYPSIAEKVLRSLIRNDLDEAVFAAFKAVEEAVRAAGGFAASDIGVPLMRKAFDKNAGRRIRRRSARLLPTSLQVPSVPTKTLTHTGLST